MKKILTIVILVSCLAIISCKNDEMIQPEGGEFNYQLEKHSLSQLIIKEGSSYYNGGNTLYGWTVYLASDSIIIGKGITGPGDLIQLELKATEDQLSLPSGTYSYPIIVNEHQVESAKIYLGLIHLLHIEEIISNFKTAEVEVQNNEGKYQINFSITTQNDEVIEGKFTGYPVLK